MRVVGSAQMFLELWGTFFPGNCGVLPIFVFLFAPRLKTGGSFRAPTSCTCKWGRAVSFLFLFLSACLGFAVMRLFSSGQKMQPLIQES